MGAIKEIEKEFQCNECGEYFVMEVPEDQEYYPCTLCEIGEGRATA